MKRASVQQLRDFYRQLDSEGKPARLIRPEDDLGHWQQIVTIRHAKPDQERKRYYTAAEAQSYLSEYDEVAIVPFDAPTFTLRTAEVPCVYTSTLPRAYQTARALFGEEIPIVQDDLFVELEREVPQVFGRQKLHRKVWPLIYRGQYFLGKQYDNIESFTNARQRLRKAGNFLTQVAQQDGAAVLVAHGLFNYFLRFNLQRKGWVRVRRSGRAYLGVTVYAAPDKRVTTSNNG